MDIKLKCPNCGNEKDFYREVHLIGKNKVSNTGKILKKVYDIDKNGELFEPIKCSNCDTVVIENGDSI